MYDPEDSAQKRKTSSSSSTPSKRHHNPAIITMARPSSSSSEQEPAGDSSDDDDHRHRGGRNGTSPPFDPSPLRNWGTRHTLTLLGFLGFASSYSMRVNLSIAIVSMVNSSSLHHHHSHHNHNHERNVSIACPDLVEAHGSHSSASGDTILNSQQQHPSSRFPKFDWSGHDQGIILGSFFYGYVATQVPGGMIAERIGGKWVFGLGMLTTAVFSLVTPLAANAGMGYLVAVRVIQGLGEGVTNPSMHALLAQWVPPLERSMLGAFVYAGTQIGTVVALPVSGWLMGNEDAHASSLTSGWPSVFYVFGILGIIWFIFWSLFVHNSPSSHPRISVAELAYIQQQEIGGGGRIRARDAAGAPCAVPSKTISSTAIATKQRNHRTPWKRMLSSGPVIAILVAQTGHGWGLYTMLTELPTYMDDVLHFDIKQNAYLSALPYLLMWIVSVVSSVYADRLRAKGVSTGLVRKIFNTIAHWSPAILLVLASHSACNRPLTVTLITMAIALNGAAWASFQVNHIDLSPHNAAVMMGITNGFANLCGIGAPYVAGVIINEGSSVSRWRVIFYIAAIVYLIDNIVYLFLASGETQAWDAANTNPSSSSSINNSESDSMFGSTRKFKGSGNNNTRPVLNVAEPSSRRTSGSTAVRVDSDDDDDDDDDNSPLLVP